jgi:cytochrome c553
MVRRSRTLATAALVVFAAACNRAPTPGLARGKALFNTCAHCHGAAGAGNRALAAPAIAGLPRWYVQAQLEGFQAAHRGYMPFDTTGMRMKSMAWTLDDSTDAASVAEYVASLAATNPAPLLRGGGGAPGQATFQVCQACHGPAAKGNPATHAPPLSGASDWYLLSQLHKFKAGWRGTDPTDVWGMTMRAQAMMLADSAAMKNVIAYIQTLR